jgi:hypothetical protein
MSNSVALAVENKSTVLMDAQVQAAIPALQQQVSYHFKPYWNEGARLVFVPSGSVPPIGSWLLSILDDSDQAGALGYHEVTSDNTPLLKVFAKTDQENGLSWTVTASHEVLEAIADPWVSSARRDLRLPAPVGRRDRSRRDHRLLGDVRARLGGCQAPGLRPGPRADGVRRGTRDPDRLRGRQPDDLCG